MDKHAEKTFTAEGIHDLRLSIAEQYRHMTPEEAERDFKSHVEKAKKTIEALRKEKQLKRNARIPVSAATTN